MEHEPLSTESRLGHTYIQRSRLPAPVSKLGARCSVFLRSLTVAPRRQNVPPRPGSFSPRPTSSPLRPFRFPYRPMAFALWFFCMDIAAWLGGTYWDSWEGRKQVSVAVGLLTLCLGYGLSKTVRSCEANRSEDYSFWCYLFGLLAFWGGLTSMDSGSELNRFLYAMINVGLVGIAVFSRRATFLVFGALGIHAYVGHLAYDVFGDSFLFPFCDRAPRTQSHSCHRVGTAHFSWAPAPATSRIAGPDQYAC